MTLREGAILETRAYRVTRADLVRYAGASGDFNPIHWSDRMATSVGLPGVIAHGMYTFALAARAVASWVDDPAAIVAVTARFTKPVVVPDDDAGAEVTVAGTVARVDLDAGVATVELTVTAGEARVLGMASASVRC